MKRQLRNKGCSIDDKKLFFMMGWMRYSIKLSGKQFLVYKQSSGGVDSSILPLFLISNLTNRK